MSSSSIIKLHHLCARPVVVGRRPKVDAVSPASPPLPVVDQESLLGQAQKEAIDLVEHARSEAAEIRACAEEEAEALRQETSAEGYRDGNLAARQEMMESSAKLETLVSNVVLENQEFLRGAEKQILELALAIARKVIQRQITIDPAAALPPIREAVESVEAASLVRIRLNPDDLDLLSAYWGGGGDPAGRKAELVADSRVKSGGCVVETKLGVVDAQIDTKLSEIERAFFLAAGFRNR